MQTGNIGLDGLLLPRRHGEVIRKAGARREWQFEARIIRRDFGVECRGTDVRDVGAAVGEAGEEFRRVEPVVAEARTGRADAVVAAGVEEGDAAGAELRVFVAHFGGVGVGDGLFVVAVGRADYLRDGG